MPLPTTFHDRRYSTARGRWLALGALAMWPAIVASSGCSRAGGAPDTRSLVDTKSSESPATDEQPPQRLETLASQSSRQAATIEQLRRTARFDEYVDAALNAADEFPDSVTIELVKSEALLAVGRDEDAERSAYNAAELALAARDRDLASLALRRWATACLRQAKPLDPAWLARFGARMADDSTYRMLSFWAEALGQRRPYRVANTGDTSRPLAGGHVGPDAASVELNAIAVRAGGAALPVVFIDTGAQHVIMTTAAAEAAGVRIGPSGLRLIGFARLVGRPGLLESLEIGDVTLHDVPVLVGDSPALVSAGGQMALGTELMHHVRFTIDYPAARVYARPAGERARPVAPSPHWQIPLWTFSQSCLAQGSASNGALARVLIDTGDRTGTYLSARWAQRHLKGFPQSRGPIVFKFKHHDLMLDTMELGNGRLSDWPVVDTLPSELERLDAVDLLVGRDLLGSYRVTFDLARRVVELAASAEGLDLVPPSNR